MCPSFPPISTSFPLFFLPLFLFLWPHHRRLSLPGHFFFPFIKMFSPGMLSANASPLTSRVQLTAWAPGPLPCDTELFQDAGIGWKK